MFGILYRYLIQHRHLALPGIGSIHLQRQSARLDFANKVFTPPAYHFSFDGVNDQPSKKLFDWLARYSAITEWEAIKGVSDFSYNLKNRIISQKEFQWDQVGVFRLEENGQIRLESPERFALGEEPVVVERVLRDHAQHMVRVGEMEKTSDEMEKLLEPEMIRKDWTWPFAIIITILLVMMLGLYFSQNGIQTDSVSNHSVIHIK